VCETGSASKLFSEPDIAALRYGETNYTYWIKHQIIMYSVAYMYMLCQAYFLIHNLHGHFEMFKFIKRLQVVSSSQTNIPYEKYVNGG